MEFIERGPYIFCLFLWETSKGFGAAFERVLFVEINCLHQMDFVVFELWASNLLCDLEFFRILKAGDSFFCFLVDLLFVSFSGGLDWVSQFLEPSDDILCDFELQVWDVLVLNVLDSGLDEIAINTLWKHGAGLKDELHFLFGQNLSCWEVLIQ